VVTVFHFQFSHRRPFPSSRAWFFVGTDGGGALLDCVVDKNGTRISPPSPRGVQSNLSRRSRELCARGALRGSDFTAANVGF